MGNPWDRYRDKKSVYQSAIRSAKYGASGAYSLEEWLELCTRHDYKCDECHETKPLTADHIVPLSRGGTNNIDNIQPLCKPCNSRKHNKLPNGVVVIPERLPPTLNDLLKRFRAHARHRLIIDVESARKLAVLTNLKQPDLTVDQCVELLIEQAWQELDRTYIQFSGTSPG